MVAGRNGTKRMFKVCNQALRSRNFIHNGHIGLRRARDALTGQLQELLKQRSRGKADDNLIAEVARLESTIVVAKDDLVRFHVYYSVSLIAVDTECLQTSPNWYQRRTQTY
jgi:hypothetical protein